MTTEDRDHGCDVADSVLHRFVDGDLSCQERRAIESLLASDADAYERAGDYQRQNVLLQALHPREVEDVSLSPAAWQLAQGLRRGRAVRRVAVAGAACLAVLSAGVGGWQAHTMLQPTQHALPNVDMFPSERVQTQAAPIAQPETGQLDDFVAPVADHPGERAVHPPNLHAIGYQLADGSADLTAYGPIIRFTYEPTAGAEDARLALMVAAFGVDRQTLSTKINPQHTSIFWRAGPLLYALSGSVEPAYLLQVVSAVDAVNAPAAPSGPAAIPQPAPETITEVPGEPPALTVPTVLDEAHQPKDT